MLDALLYAARDCIRAAKIGYGYAECYIGDDGRPQPRAGNWSAVVHGGRSQSGPANSRNLDELFGFSVTLTGRIIGPLDNLGENMIARNIPLRDLINNVPLAQRQGFNARLEQLRTLLHMNWAMTVLQGQTTPSANDNIIAWCTGTVYGFVEPARYQGEETPVLVGGDWFGAEPELDQFGLKTEMKFSGARRMQPQTASVGVFT